MSFPTYARTVANYSDFTKKIEQAKSFRIVTKFKNCTTPTGKPTHSNAIAYSTPTSFMAQEDKKLISTSTLHFTNHRGFPTYEHVRYTFGPNNQALIEVFTLDPQTMQASKQNKVFSCILNKDIFVHIN